jgi:hypothetical protein
MCKAQWQGPEKRERHVCLCVTCRISPGSGVKAQAVSSNWQAEWCWRLPDDCSYRCYAL